MHSSWSIVSEAIAQPAPAGNLKQFSMPKETSSQQIARGLFGSVAKNVWFVIAGSHPTKEAADRQADGIRRRGFSADVYAPYGGNQFYAVVIGAQLSLSQAQQLQTRAIASGLPKDMYLWTFAQR